MQGGHRQRPQPTARAARVRRRAVLALQPRQDGAAAARGEGAPPPGRAARAQGGARPAPGGP